MDEPSAQLQETLDCSIRKALTSKRPILTHLNADTSWLVQIPYPSDAMRLPGRSRLNILFDPWFRGPQTDVATFFSTQWHTVESCVQSMSELSERLQDIEMRAQPQAEHLAKGRHLVPLKKSQTPYIDAVVISHEFTDHCNKRTLLELDIDTPVFATKRAADLIRSWSHFTLVQDVPPFSCEHSDWRKASLYPLPSWLGLAQMVSQRDSLDYHSAILLTFNVSQTSLTDSLALHSPAEGIIYTPHGIHAKDLECLPSAKPTIRILVLLHGLHDVKLSIRKLNLGAHNGLKAQRICKAKYWVSTHDEIKRATGLIAPWLYRNALTFREALEEERKRHGKIKGDSELFDVRQVTFADLSSGESLLLV